MDSAVWIFAGLRVLLFVVAGGYAVLSAVTNRFAPVERLSHFVSRPRARLIMGAIGIFPLGYGLVALLGIIRILLRG
jgi:hypothetical protein